MGFVGLRDLSAVGIAHCDIAHCQEVKNPNMLGLSVVMWWFIYYTDEKSSDGKTISTQVLYLNIQMQIH